MKNTIRNFTDEYIVKYLKKVPGEQRFGIYRFLPFFFIFGASLEYLMIHLKAGPNQVNFYSTLKRKQAEQVLDQKEKLESYFKSESNSI
ncbi:unnamed protein product [Brachionus calyciflorus]|uniref:Small integral membrane protein 4 n=1 Tax=Brachionus calyciflorus TaxID=104777 RepID=A0A813WWB3_9BILA|nr:unnamed protein product [Brachionus calyciflorus]